MKEHFPEIVREYGINSDEAFSYSPYSASYWGWAVVFALLSTGFGIRDIIFLTRYFGD